MIKKEKAKTYRVDAGLAKEACERMLKFITDEQTPVTEAQIINASIKKGLPSLSNEEIKDYIK